MIHTALWIASALFLALVGLLLLVGGLAALAKLFEVFAPKDKQREAKIKAFEERAKEVHRAQSERARALVLEHPGLKWMNLCMTLGEWRRKVGTSITHEGTVLRTERGVFCAGLIGSFYIGQKRTDGTLDRSTEEDWASWPAIDQAEIVLEYADPLDGYPAGCYRTPEGGIHCVCEDWE